MLKNIVAPSLNRASRIDLLPVVPETATIPKIIHQTFHVKNLPEELQRNVERIRGMNPDWDYRLYDDADILSFVQENYGTRIAKYFQKINPLYGAARADLFRYLVLYRCGGVYFDIKSFPSKPLSEVIREDDSYLLSYWSDKHGDEFAGWGFHDELAFSRRGEFQQWHIVSAAGHPFLKAVLGNVLSNIDLYNPVIHGTGKKGTVRLTGPIAYSLAINPLLPHHKHRLVEADSDLGFKYSVYKQMGHESIFKVHYSKLTEPIIEVGVLRILLGKFVVGIRRVKKRLGYAHH